MDHFVSPYRICASIFIKIYKVQRESLSPKENGKVCIFILNLIYQVEYSFKQLTELIEANCNSSIILGQFKNAVNDVTLDINNLFQLFKQIRDDVERNSVSGLFLRKVAIYFDRLTHQSCSKLFDDLKTYAASSTHAHSKRPSPRTTRSSNILQHSNKLYSSAEPIPSSSIHQINHEIVKLQANEARARNPKELHELLRRPSNACKSDATFLRYLNLLRVNESVGSKHLLMAYFDMVPDTVSRSYSALNFAIYYLHHGHYKRAIECLQECYCCAQSADDEKCLSIALMWLARVIIQAKQKDSSVYNVKVLLEFLRKRSHKAELPYVQAMSSITLEQLIGPVDDSAELKKFSEKLKQLASNNRRQDFQLMMANQSNPLDNNDITASAEILAVKNSLNDVLAMYYALLSAHFNMLSEIHSSALASQTLLHFDLIEKCGDRDVLLVNESIFIAVRNLAYHVWNLSNDINLVRNVLFDLCEKNIAFHRTDNHSIWRQAWAEVSFEYYLQNDMCQEAEGMVTIIGETNKDLAQLRHAELLKHLGMNDEALDEVENLINKTYFEENNFNPCPVEHRVYIRSKALLLQAILCDNEELLLESLNYATTNKFKHIRTACLMQLAESVIEDNEILQSIVIEVMANGTKMETRKMMELLSMKG